MVQVTRTGKAQLNIIINNIIDHPQAAAGILQVVMVMAVMAAAVAAAVVEAVLEMEMEVEERVPNHRHHVAAAATTTTTIPIEQKTPREIFYTQARLRVWATSTPEHL